MPAEAGTHDTVQRRWEPMQGCLLAAHTPICETCVR